jgi:hypothetical protein
LWRNEQNQIAQGRKVWNLKVFAGKVPMDRVRQDWINEYAETGSAHRPGDNDLSLGSAPRFAALSRRRPAEQNASRFTLFAGAQLRARR